MTFFGGGGRFILFFLFILAITFTFASGLKFFRILMFITPVCEDIMGKMADTMPSLSVSTRSARELVFKLLATRLIDIYEVKLKGRTRVSPRRGH